MLHTVTTFNTFHVNSVPSLPSPQHQSSWTAHDQHPHTQWQQCTIVAAPPYGQTHSTTSHDPLISQNDSGHSSNPPSSTTSIHQLCERGTRRRMAADHHLHHASPGQYRRRRNLQSSLVPCGWSEHRRATTGSAGCRSTPSPWSFD